MACSKPKKEEMRSQIPAEKRQFTWRVDHWAAIQKSEALIDATSVEFEMGAGIGLPITVKVYLQETEDKGEKQKRGKETNLGKYVGLYFKVVASPTDVSPVLMEIHCHVPNMFRGTFEVRDFATKDGWGWKDFMAQNTSSRLPLDSNGSLPITLEVTLFNVKGAVSKILPPPTPPPPPVPIPVVTVATLMAKWKEPFLKKLLQDKDDLRKSQGSFPSCMEIVVLVSKEGKGVRVNGLTLAERSPFFREKLQKPFKSDGMGNRVMKLEGIGVEALDVFLTFLQTATLPEDKWKQPGILEELAMAAHKFQAQDLLEFLEEALEIVCTPKNCADLIVLTKKLELKMAQKSLLDKYKKEWKQARGLAEMMQLFESAALAACPKEPVKVKDSSKMKEKLQKVVSSFF